MKLIDLKCPRCGATLKNIRDRNNIVCQYCGNSFVLDDETKVVRYDSESAEEAGYQFEKGRLRAQNESNSATTINGYVKQQKRKKNTWLWVLGWICIFPVPLTVILVKNKNINSKLKIGIVTLVWVVYLLIALLGGNSSEDNKTSNSIYVIETTENETTEIETTEVKNSITNEKSLELIYADDEVINLYLNDYNAKNSTDKIEDGMFEKYYHHGREHDDQIKMSKDGFEIVLSSIGMFEKKIDIVIQSYDNKSNDDYREIYNKFMAGLELEDVDYDKCFDEVLNNNSHYVSYDNFEVNFKCNDGKIVLVQISRKYE